MVTLGSIADTIWMLVAAALVGAFGGVVGELIATRGSASDTGAWEKPRRAVEGIPSYRDLGSWASIPIGLVAGPLAITLVSPVQTGADGVRRYAIERMVGLALVAGVAGPAYLRQAAAKAVAQIDAEVARRGLEVTQAAIAARPGDAPIDVTAHAATTEAVAAAALRPRPGHYKI